jgi:hypothetical protein
MNTLFVGTVLLLGLFHLATLRAGHDWGDDFSLYIAHARNLAEGHPYADTGYIYNPNFPVLSPRTYPPVFPALLVPVYQLFGMNLVAMKAFVVVVFMAFLAVFGAFLRRHLPAPYALGCLWMVGLNPFVWQHKDRLLSEVPFMFFAYLALLLLDVADRNRESAGRLFLWGVAAGVAAYLAVGTRTVGVVLIPALLVAELMRPRSSPGHWLWLWVMLPFCGLMMLQKTLLPSDASYFDQLQFDLRLFVQVGVDLVKAMGMFFDNGYYFYPRIILFVSLSILAAIGFVDRLRERPTAHAFFAVFSFLLLVFWPYADWQRRYLMPILPLYFYYACEGLCRLGTISLLTRLERPAAVALSLAVLVSYGACFTRLEMGPFRQGVSTPEAVALFDFIRTRTQPDDVFMFQKPRALALFTGRRSSGHQEQPSDEQLWTYLRQINATHVVVTPQFPNSHRLLGSFIARYPGQFDSVFHQGDITVYRIAESRQASR